MAHGVGSRVRPLATSQVYMTTDTWIKMERITMLPIASEGNRNQALRRTVPNGVRHRES
jgi:hypothetical protein